MKSSRIAALSRNIPFLACALMVLPAQGQELAPDDPAVAASLGAWFRDAANTFDPEAGTWADSSGNGRHVVTVGEVNVNGQHGSGMYSVALPERTTFIRTAQISPQAIDGWFNIVGTPQLAINLTGVSYTTSSDDSTSTTAPNFLRRRTRPAPQQGLLPRQGSRIITRIIQRTNALT